MKDISISSILNSMNGETAYLTDMWENCVDEKKKRFPRSKFSAVLDKMEELGYLKKQGYKSEITYTQLKFNDASDHIGFINDLIFTNETIIKKTLKKLDSKKIFIDISKDLNAHKFNKFAVKDYDLFLKSITSMLGISSSILLTIKNSDNSELKKELKQCLNQIKEFLDETNEILMKFRGSNERIVLQRILNNRITEPGFLKI
jgi:predicted nuclease of predicted toxin-antitoxin system